ncbi:hypothetical protein GGS26DRAFT_554588 [Hypomontagnella submonticulosa]|nr:hypothetical protein GGS26DRAFT_554588 [Hypomontagnella submonticulosa]
MFRLPNRSCSMLRMLLLSSQFILHTDTLRRYVKSRPTFYKFTQYGIGGALHCARNPVGWSGVMPVSGFAFLLRCQGTRRNIDLPY